jgi:predicted transcriptional regulator
MTTITARIDDKLIEKLNLISEKTERSKSYLIRKAIENFIIDSQEELNDIQISLSREQESIVYSSEEMNEMLFKTCKK